MTKTDTDPVHTFNEERRQLNELVLKHGGQVTKRFFNLDTQTYQDGALPAKTKELIGLVASLVLRCDDCVKYHLDQCYRQGVTTPELIEAIETGLYRFAIYLSPIYCSRVLTISELRNIPLDYFLIRNGISCWRIDYHTPHQKSY